MAYAYLLITKSRPQNLTYQNCVSQKQQKPQKEQLNNSSLLVSCVITQEFACVTLDIIQKTCIQYHRLTFTVSFQFEIHIFYEEIALLFLFTNTKWHLQIRKKRQVLEKLPEKNIFKPHFFFSRNFSLALISMYLIVILD